MAKPKGRFSVRPSDFSSIPVDQPPLRDSFRTWKEWQIFTWAFLIFATLSLGFIAVILLNGWLAVGCLVTAVITVWADHVWDRDAPSQP